MGENKFKTKPCARFYDPEGICKEKAKCPAYSGQNQDKKNKKRERKEKKGTC